jgi:hypothetical protein
MSNNERDGLSELGATFVGSAVRLGLTVASAPLILLPKGARRRARRTMAEVARAMVILPKELAGVSERLVDEIFGVGEPTPTVPSTERSGERGRPFTERLARAADELAASVDKGGESPSTPPQA